jgi:hypothetical protein
MAEMENDSVTEIKTRRIEPQRPPVHRLLKAQFYN